MARDRMASTSTPLGSAPKTSDGSLMRPAQKAANTAPGALVCSSEACTSSATSRARRRAWVSRRWRRPGRGAHARPARARPHGRCAHRRRLDHQRISHRPGAQRAQQVQGLDVGRAFPDRVERHLAVDARHHAFAVFFDVAVAAQAFHGLLREGAAALADPELGDRREHAAHHGFGRRRPGRARCGPRRAPGASPARWRPRFPAPGRPARSSSSAARSGACRRPGAARCGAAPATAPGASGRRCPGRSPAASSRPWPGSAARHGQASPTSQAVAPWNSTSLLALAWLPSLCFRRWMASALTRPSGSQRGRKKQLSPARPLRQHQEGVAHRRREEPLVAGDGVTRSPQASRPSATARVVLARTSEPPCFSVMPMPSVTAVLCAAGHEARVVARAGDAPAPVGPHAGIGAQRGRDGITHRHRAQHRRLELGEQHEGRSRFRHGCPALRPRGCRAGGGAAPRPSARGSWGGTRPGRCGGRSGRGCAARARVCWPAWRGSASALPTSAGPAPAARASSKPGWCQRSASCSGWLMAYRLTGPPAAGPGW